MAHPPPHSYLLRLWREHPAAPLRVTLTPVSQPDAPRHFADLEALFAFLRAQEGGAVLAHDERFTT
jgi:hypothetical protein